MKRLSTWDEWGKSERNKLNQMHDLVMFGKPIDAPKNSIVLRPHWQYSIKRNGTCRSRQCCGGSKIYSPIFIELTLTYISCVEHPFRRLFLALADHLDLRIYGCDTYDAFMDIPGPSVTTFVFIYDQFSYWYRHKFGNNIVRYKVIPVLRTIHSHTESGRLWESLINQILKRVGFTTTTDDRNIYKDVYNTNVETIYLLRQVDEFSISCSNKSVVEGIYDQIGGALQLPSESDK